MISVVMLLMMSQLQRPLPNPLPKPLPKMDEFLQATRTELMLQLDEDEILKGYVYRRKTSHEKLGRDGMAKAGEVVEHDVFQFDAGSYSLIISKNGVPAIEQELKKQDSGPPFAPKSRDDHEKVIDDMFRVWKFQLVRREMIAGRPAVVVAFEPKDEAKPKTLAGKWMLKNSKGVAWVDEADHRIVRMRTMIINDISLAWGMVAKVHKGTEITREWRKINDEVWLPARSQKRFRGRAFMVGFNFLEIEEYSDYRKFDVETKLTFGGPK